MYTNKRHYNVGSGMLEARLRKDSMKVQVIYRDCADWEQVSLEVRGNKNKVVAHVTELLVHTFTLYLMRKKSYPEYPE